MKKAPNIKTLFQKIRGNHKTWEGKIGYPSEPHILVPTFFIKYPPPVYIFLNNFKNPILQETCCIRMSGMWNKHPSLQQ